MITILTFNGVGVGVGVGVAIDHQFCPITIIYYGFNKDFSIKVLLVIRSK